MSTWKSLLGPMRVPFLVLTPACVFLGLGTAIWASGRVNWFQVFMVLIGALSAHISVNAFNEYYDFKTGLDFKTQRTPFSGGSGTLPREPGMARPALITAWVAFTVTILVGVYFLSIRGILLLPLGVAGLVVIFLYTTWMVYHPSICLMAPGLGFGPLMVMGTHFALTGAYSWSAFIASLVPFFLVSNLLLLNQFPDVEADKHVGRKHFPITIGKKKSAYIYGSFLFFAYLAVVIGATIGLLPGFSLLSLLTVFLAVPVSRGVLRHFSNIKDLIPYMGLNVVINIATPVLLGLGLLMA